MITCKKEFGSYKLITCEFYRDIPEDEGKEEVFVSSCTIGSKWTSLVLDKIIPYNHDTSIFRFLLPDMKSLQLPIGSVLLIRGPSCDHDGEDAVRPYTSISDPLIAFGYFDIICKRYDQWGTKESVKTHFLFTQTNHSYKPPGALSNYIHSLRVGQTLDFKHDSRCLPRFSLPINGVSSFTMIAVGVGLAPMIQMIRFILQSNAVAPIEDVRSRIVLLYGVRTYQDILVREMLEEWREAFEFNREDPELKVVYCVGSRFDNVIMGGKTSQPILPKVPTEFSRLKNAELGWVNEDKIRRHAFPPSQSTRVFICGLPGVYDKICGARFSSDVPSASVLARLGYTEELIIKL